LKKELCRNLTLLNLENSHEESPSDSGKYGQVHSDTNFYFLIWRLFGVSDVLLVSAEQASPLRLLLRIAARL
jgi:hypothetical protein